MNEELPELPGFGEFDNVTPRKEAQKRPTLTFFYEKTNGEAFAAEEKEAANGKYQLKFRYLGWSDGTTHQKVIKEANIKSGQILSKEDARKLLLSAFDAELEKAKQNIADARANNTFIVTPEQTTHYFHNSVPLDVRNQLSQKHESI